MATYIDIAVFLLASSVWLAPFLYNACHRRARLIHPVSWFPINVVWYFVPPLIYRYEVGAMTRTGMTLAGDEWFLAGPMLIVGLCGLFYHFGVFISGTSLRLGKRDGVEPYASFPTARGTNSTVLFLCCCGALGIASLLQAWAPAGSSSRGYYWMQLLYLSIYTLPLLMINQHRGYGLLLLTMCLPATLLWRSKGGLVVSPRNS